MTLVNVGWRVGTRKNRRYCIQTVSGPHTSQLPVELTHGKTANFMVSFDVTSNWKKEFAQGFVKDLSDKSLKTLRALIDTSVGQTIEVRPEQDLLEEIKKAREC